MRKPPGERRQSLPPSWLSQAVASSLRDFPLTWGRNTQIWMYWLLKWIESCNNCTFWTLKNKVVFNLLFWIPNSFWTYHDYGRRGTPFLASPDGLSLIFYHSEFWTTFLPWQTVALKLFTALKYVLSFRISEQLLLALKNRVCPEFAVLNMQFLSFRILNNLLLPWKTELPWNFLLY